MSVLPLLLICAIGADSSTSSETSLTAHPNSFSNLVFHLEDEGLKLEWWIQARTLMEEPELEFDAEDLWLCTQLEAEAAWPSIQAYLEEGFTIRVDGELWQPAFADFALEENGFTFKVESFLELPQRASKLEVRLDHFFDGANPEHFVAIDVYGFEEEVDRWILMWGKREASFPVARASDDGAELGEESTGTTFSQLFAIGRDHVLGGLDHLAFLLALLFGVARLRALIAARSRAGRSRPLGLSTGFAVWGGAPPCFDCGDHRVHGFA